jgi:TatD DNase family protein
MLIDTHAHLDYPDYQNDLQQVLHRAHQAGVTRCISISTDLHSCHRILELTQTYPSIIYPVLGIHPHHANEWDQSTEAILSSLINLHSIAAIGEAGLDYHHLPGKKISDPDESAQADLQYKTKQQDIFKKQLDLAAQKKLNIVIHQRDAWEDTLAILRPYTSQLRAVFHCFGGTLEQAKEIIALGHLVSFTGIITFKNAAQVQETASRLPSSSFMVETDCPYLAPTPYRGKRCEPAHTRLVAEKIAQLRGLTLESISKETTQLAESFFRLSS